MDDALEARQIFRLSVYVFVSILVLMDDALEVIQIIKSWHSIFYVSILVLMDDALEGQ